MTTNPAFLTAAEAVDLMDRGEVTPIDIVESNLTQIKKLDPVLKAFICLDEAGARFHAERLTKELRQGKRRSPLHGITVAVKDVLDVAGMRTTHGTRALKDAAPATADADAIGRLREAGVIFLGKTNTPAFAAYAHTTNALVGTTVSPWDTSLSSGGSSGGSAVAVATGMCTLAIGTDLGGSVRGPAAWAGAFGIRPTAGRVSNQPHGWVDDTIDVVGVLARDARDLRLWLDAAEACTAKPRQPLEDALSIGYSVDLGGAIAVDPDIREVFSRAIDDLRRAGVPVTERAPDVDAALKAIRPLRALRALAMYADADLEAIAQDNKNLALFLERARGMSGLELGEGASLRTQSWKNNAGFFNDFSAFLMPTAQFSGIASDRVQPDFVDGHKIDDPLTAWHSTYIVSVLGWPVVAIPCGLTQSGRPVGAQLIGPRGSETHLLAMAESLCRKVGWKWQPPPIAVQT
jgi:amidase